jgi:hypothetical protein
MSKKFLLVSLVGLTSQVFAYSSVFETVVATLESDYKMICTDISDDKRVHCHASETKQVGIDVEQVDTRSGDIKINFSEYNHSGSEVLKQNMAKDGEFWGEKIVAVVTEKLQGADDFECSKLEDNFIGEKKSYIYKPLWHYIKRSTCANDEGTLVKIRVDLGTSGNMLQSIKIIL